MMKTAGKTSRHIDRAFGIFFYDTAENAANCNLLLWSAPAAVVATAALATKMQQENRGLSSTRGLT